MDDSVAPIRRRFDVDDLRRATAGTDVRRTIAVQAVHDADETAWLLAQPAPVRGRGVGRPHRVRRGRSAGVDPEQHRRRPTGRHPAPGAGRARPRLARPPRGGPWRPGGRQRRLGVRPARPCPRARGGGRPRRRGTGGVVRPRPRRQADDRHRGLRVAGPGAGARRPAERDVQGVGAPHRGRHRLAGASRRPVRPHGRRALRPDRSLFGSDWPVSTLAAGYAEVLRTTGDALADLSSTERDAVFRGTAERVYLAGAPTQT